MLAAWKLMDGGVGAMKSHMMWFAITICWDIVNVKVGSRRWQVLATGATHNSQQGKSCAGEQATDVADVSEWRHPRRESLVAEAGGCEQTG